MFKVVQYIDTIGTKNYQELMKVPFDIRHISSKCGECNEKLNDNDPVVDPMPLFQGWTYSKIDNSHHFLNNINNRIGLRFYNDYYVIIINNKEYTLSLPKTINDFINDMFRFNIDLYWNDYIEIGYEPKDFLAENEIENYYRSLLNNIDKNEELL